jgi:hypothetical protein
MTKPRSCLLALSLLTCVAANADSLLVFTSGEFSSSGITANSMAADGADWTLPSFAQNDTPSGGFVYDATPLTLESGPCPLADFNAVVDRVVGIPFNN